MELTEQEWAAAEAAALYSEGRYDVSSDDVFQEIWIWVLTHQHKVEQWREGGDKGFGAFKKSIRNAAYDYCEAERVSTLGADPQDHYTYSRGKIRSLLPDALDLEWSWNDAPTTHNVRVSELVDIRRAYEGALSDWGREILSVAADCDFEYENVAGYLEMTNQDHGMEDYEVSADAARERVAYHVDRMRAYLGGPEPDREWAGSRKVISSAEAAAIYTRQYGG